MKKITVKELIKELTSCSEISINKVNDDTTEIIRSGNLKFFVKVNIPNNGNISISSAFSKMRIEENFMNRVVFENECSLVNAYGEFDSDMISLDIDSIENLQNFEDDWVGFKIATTDKLSVTVTYCRNTYY